MALELPQMAVTNIFVRQEVSAHKQASIQNADCIPNDGFCIPNDSPSQLRE